MYIADLHIHSKYSRATSKTCVPEHLDLWARRKGIDLLGTGDFTHPAWRAELHEKLLPAEDGLYKLSPSCRLHDDLLLNSHEPRFVISGEISSIYKKNGKVRKVHNVILLPSLDFAEELSRKLEAIGNIHSDGRPILGLDSRDLLEITLETCSEAIFIPAHIWTPHFSMFGAFSGFDTIEECFEDLTPHIYALETGLSSDPAMNWRLSALDSYTLVSNSDAHSPSKLGREANLIQSELSYAGLAHAIKHGAEGGFAGTIEFFPEEGKYHLDGHRNCHLCLTPAETEKLGGKCPICGKKITIGVQHRVEQLADRPESFVLAGAPPYESLAPLAEVIAGSTGLSSTSKKVQQQYETLLRKLGSEFHILRQAPLEDLLHIAGPFVSEGIKRLREGIVERIPGFDGEYGVIKLLDDADLSTLSGQTSFLSQEEMKKATPPAPILSVSVQSPASPISESTSNAPKETDLLKQLNPQQLEAVTASAPAVAVIAGPGTGKTKTLVSRIAYLVQRLGAKPSEITAVTFTNKAAAEMRHRLEQQLGGKRAVRNMAIGTFHALCLKLLEDLGNPSTLIGENEALEFAAATTRAFDLKLAPLKLLREISKWKNGMSCDHDSVTPDVISDYNKRLQTAGVMDLDDLLLNVLNLCENGKLNAKQNRTFTYLLVDEFQDINSVQFQLIESWSKRSKNLFVIGDPDQAIYGFRGSDPACFASLAKNHPALHRIELVQNYRSSPEILNCALSVITAGDGVKRHLSAQRESGETVQLLTAQSDLSEGIYIAKQINRLVGGMDMLDTYGFARPSETETVRSLSEIAVLYRTHKQEKQIENCLHQEGIPYTVVGRSDLLADQSVRAAVSFFRFLLNPKDFFSLRVCLSHIYHCPETLCEQVVSALQTQKDSTGLSDLLPAFQNEPAICDFLESFSLCFPRVYKEKPAKLLERWADSCGLADSEGITQLIQIAANHSDTDTFLKTLIFGQESDFSRTSGKNYTSDAVTLMTLHGCKGLEFPVVFLAGVNEGIIPLESNYYVSDRQEERRLFYVGMTRAKDSLYLLTSPAPSPFLDALPADLVHRADTHIPRKQPVQQLSLFD